MHANIGHFGSPLLCHLHLSLVRTAVLNGLGKITPNSLIFLVLFFLHGGTSLLCLPLHMAYKEEFFQLSLVGLACREVELGAPRPCGHFEKQEGVIWGRAPPHAPDKSQPSVMMVVLPWSHFGCARASEAV